MFQRTGLFALCRMSASDAHQRGEEGSTGTGEHH
jgi:hypothetical protein